CWQTGLGMLKPQNYMQCYLSLCIRNRNCCRVHVHNVQVCYICILVPCCCAAPIDSSFPTNRSFTSL
uniref:Uncharacterized protein n=1 Tax=Macaca fascicularis TaxID=9541 RepID=A0A7N9C717_MACFA